MELNIVAAFGIIEEAYKAANRTYACFPVCEISSNQFSAGFFKFRFVSDNHPLLIASDLILGLVRFELAGIKSVQTL